MATSPDTAATLDQEVVLATNTTSLLSGLTSTAASNVIIELRSLVLLHSPNATGITLGADNISIVGASGLTTKAGALSDASQPGVAPPPPATPQTPTLLILPPTQMGMREGQTLRFVGHKVVTTTFNILHLEPGAAVGTVKLELEDCTLSSMYCGTNANLVFLLASMLDLHVSMDGDVPSTYIEDSGWITADMRLLGFKSRAFEPAPTMYRVRNTTITCEPSMQYVYHLQRQIKSLEVPEYGHKLCYDPSDRGMWYRGDVSVTASGENCRAWAPEGNSSSGPWSPVIFPNAGFEGNACRNSLDTLAKPWCFTEGWPFTEVCDIPACTPEQLTDPDNLVPLGGGITPADTYSSRWTDRDGTPRAPLIAIVVTASFVLVVGAVLAALATARWLRARQHRLRSSDLTSSLSIPHSPMLPPDAPTSDLQCANHVFVPDTDGAESADGSSSLNSGTQVPLHPQARSVRSCFSNRAHTPKTAALSVADSSNGAPSSITGSACLPLPPGAGSKGEVALATRAHEAAMRASEEASTGRPGPDSPNVYRLSDPSLGDSVSVDVRAHLRPFSRSLERHALHVSNDVYADALSRSISDSASLGCTGEQIEGEEERGGAEGAAANVTTSDTGGGSGTPSTSRTMTGPYASSSATMPSPCISPFFARASTFPPTFPSLFPSSLDRNQFSPAEPLAMLSSSSSPSQTRPSATAIPGDSTHSACKGAESREYPGAGMAARLAASASPDATRKVGGLGARALATLGIGHKSAPKPEKAEKKRSGTRHTRSSSIVSRDESLSSGAASALGVHPSPRDFVVHSSLSVTMNSNLEMWDHDIKVGKLLGRGSHGHVHLGLWHDNPVAIKIIETSPQDYERSLLEAQISSELAHPNIVTTYKYGWADHRQVSVIAVKPGSHALVIIMEYCNLRSLALSLQRSNRFGQMSNKRKWPAIVHTATAVLRALQYLHAKNIVHGDVKASNVLLKSVPEDDNPWKFTAKLADLGLAHQQFAPGRGGGAVGSLTHAAPELLGENAVNTPQSDIYAFAVLLYELITARKPYEGCSASEVIARKTSGRAEDSLSFQDCTDARDDLLKKFDEIFQACIAHDPEQRPASRALYEKLRKIAEEEGLLQMKRMSQYTQISLHRAGTSAYDSTTGPSLHTSMDGRSLSSLAFFNSAYSHQDSLTRMCPLTDTTLHNSLPGVLANMMTTPRDRDLPEAVGTEHSTGANIMSSPALAPLPHEVLSGRRPPSSRSIARNFNKSSASAAGSSSVGRSTQSWARAVDAATRDTTSFTVSELARGPSGSGGAGERAASAAAAGPLGTYRLTKSGEIEHVGKMPPTLDSLWSDVDALWKGRAQSQAGLKSSDTAAPPPLDRFARASPALSSPQDLPSPRLAADLFKANSQEEPAAPTAPGYASKGTLFQAQAIGTGSGMGTIEGAASVAASLAAEDLSPNTSQYVQLMLGGSSSSTISPRAKDSKATVDSDDSFTLNYGNSSNLQRILQSTSRQAGPAGATSAASNCMGDSSAVVGSEGVTRTASVLTDTASMLVASAAFSNGAHAAVGDATASGRRGRGGRSSTEQVAQMSSTLSVAQPVPAKDRVGGDIKEVSFQSSRSFTLNNLSTDGPAAVVTVEQADRACAEGGLVGMSTHERGIVASAVLSRLFDNAHVRDGKALLNPFLPLTPAPASRAQASTLDSFAPDLSAPSNEGTAVVNDIDGTISFNFVDQASNATDRKSVPRSRPVTGSDPDSHGSVLPPDFRPSMRSLMVEAKPTVEKASREGPRKRAWLDALHGWLPDAMSASSPSPTSSR